MRRLRYSVATSLDGFIADADGGYDWIIEDSDIDFVTYLARFDTLLMGRGTYEVTQNQEGPGIEGMKTYVVSTTLDPAEHPDVTVISDDIVGAVEALKAEAGKDIWLFGGGKLFRGLLEAGVVDEVEVAVIPSLLGQGIPLVAGLDGVATLRLESTQRYPTGILMLNYEVVGG